MPANRWLHVPTGEVWTFAGEDRDSEGKPYAVMTQHEAGVDTSVRIDPLALVTKGGDWKKADA